MLVIPTIISIGKGLAVRRGGSISIIWRSQRAGRNSEIHRELDHRGWDPPIEDGSITRYWKAQCTMSKPYLKGHSWEETISCNGANAFGSMFWGKIN